MRFRFDGLTMSDSDRNYVAVSEQQETFSGISCVRSGDGLAAEIPRAFVGADGGLETAAPRDAAARRFIQGGPPDGPRANKENELVHL